MPTHGDYPWERDERKRRQGEPQPRAQRIAPPQGSPRPPMAYSSRLRRTRSSQGNVGASALLVAAIAAMLYGGFTIANEPDFAPPQYAQPQPQPQPQAPPARQPSVPAAPGAPLRVKSRFVSPGVLEVWGSTPAPDGTTVIVAVKRSGGDRWSKLGEAPVARGHFLLRQTLAQGLQGGRLRIRAVLV
jgi:hypothetical protein